MWVDRYLGAYNKIKTLQIKLKFPLTSLVGLGLMPAILLHNFHSFYLPHSFFFFIFSSFSFFFITKDSVYQGKQQRSPIMDILSPS